MADFPVNSYQAVTSKLQAIRDKVSRREMPPWPADADASLPFNNDPRLDPADIAKIVAWIDAGAPQGDEADLPSEPIFARGWSHPGGRAPDAVVTLPRYTLAANGEIPYQERLIKLPFEDDRWLSAIEVRAGNPRVLHRGRLIFASKSDGRNTHYFPGVFDPARVSCGFYYRSCYP